MTQPESTEDAVAAARERFLAGFVNPETVEHGLRVFEGAAPADERSKASAAPESALLNRARAFVEAGARSSPVCIACGWAQQQPWIHGDVAIEPHGHKPDCEAVALLAVLDGAPYEPIDAEVERATKEYARHGRSSRVDAMRAALRAAWGGEAQ